MGVTPAGIPYPPGPDVPDARYWLRARAEALDAALRPQMTRGTVSMSLAGGASATAAVTFPTAFPTPPIVVASYGSTASTLPRVFVGAYNVTTTGCTLLLASADGTTSTGSRPVSYWAVLA